MSLNDLFPEMGEEQDNAQIIDLSQIVISNLMFHFKDDEEVNLNIVRNVVLESIKKHVLKNKREYPEVVIAVDAKNYWRQKIAYYYKKHRKKIKEKSGRDWTSIYEAMNTVRQELIENFPYKVVYLPDIGAEADDTIAVLVKYFISKKPDVKIHIVSSDGDFTQLQKFKNVRQYDPIHDKFVKPKHGSPERDLRTKLVKGDPKDGIANIFSKSDFILTKEDGSKVRQKSIRSDLLASVYESKDPRSLFTGEVLDRYDENKKLIDFDEIPEYVSDAIIEQYENYIPAKRGKLNKYFFTHGLTNFIGLEMQF